MSHVVGFGNTIFV